MYFKLPYYQYFIDTSGDYNNTGKARYKIKYVDVPYYYKGKRCHANYEVHYEKERNVIQINFEKTHGKLDWLVNFMFTPRYYDSFNWKGCKISLRVHKGWAAMYKAVKDNVRKDFLDLQTCFPDAKTEIIGWSLGSGQAMLCAEDLFFNFRVRPYVYTYGSVNPFKTNIFNRKKTKKFLRNCCEEVYNFCDKSDIVTYVPFRLFGFIKIRRVAINGRFKFFGLLNPYKYHTHYDQPDLYTNINTK